MTTLNYIEDSLDDIKRIISYYSDTIDYSNYIYELNNILEMLEHKSINCTDSNDFTKISNLKNRAHQYLDTAKRLQVHYENQGESTN